MTTQKTLQVVVPSKNTLRQFLTVAVAVFLAVLAYNYFLPQDNNSKEIYEQANKQLQNRIDELERNIGAREAASDLRKDSIAVLENKLQMSKANIKNLKTQLNATKRKLQKATDADNIYFYSKYIHNFRSNK